MITTLMFRMKNLKSNPELQIFRKQSLFITETKVRCLNSELEANLLEIMQQSNIPTHTSLHILYRKELPLTKRLNKSQSRKPIKPTNLTTIRTKKKNFLQMITLQEHHSKNNQSSQRQKASKEQSMKTLSHAKNPSKVQVEVKAPMVENNLNLLNQT